MSATDLVSEMPQFKLVEAYIDTINHVVGKLASDSPYNELTPNYRIKVEALKKAIYELRVEFATQFKFL